MPRPSTYDKEFCKTLAEKRNCQFISSKGFTAKSSAVWKCLEHNQEFKMNIPTFASGSTRCKGCVYFAKCERLFKECHAFAKSKGGVCLTKEPIGDKDKYDYLCKENHSWSNSHRQSVGKKKWCRICEPPVKWSEKRCHEVAKEKNGKFLDKFTQASKKHKWECEFEHQFMLKPTEISSNNTWCPYCAGKHIDLNTRYQAIAKKRGGYCHTKNIKTTRQKLDLECGECGFKWQTRGTELDDSPSRKGTWCPNCAPTMTLTLELAQTVAEDRGGECLSEEYINDREHMCWKCEKGHIWKACLHNIISRKSWCPKCKKFKNENFVRKIFEELTDYTFDSIYPDWLKYHKRNLELDGYNKDLEIAFEVQGEQHYVYNKFLHRGDKNNLVKQQERDNWKEAECEELGIDLIIIDGREFNYRKPNKLRKHIIKRLLDVGFEYDESD